MTPSQKRLKIEELNNRDVASTTSPIVTTNGAANSDINLNHFDYPNPQNSMKMRATRTESTALMMRNGGNDGC